MMAYMTLRERIEDALGAIGAPQPPDFAIILGTGLGALAQHIQRSASIPYEKIPHFASSSVVSHKGELILGTLEGRPVVAMEGRLHAYEGHSMEQITFPVRVMRALGARVLIVSNAAGGLNPAYQKGDLILIDDHINLMGANPLVGPNDEALGPRFPDLSRPYDPRFIEQVEKIAADEKIRTHRGVYLALTGPNLETRAEYRFLRNIGADLVGMSTVPEVLVGVHGGFRILGISIVTDTCDPDHLEPVDVETIIAVAREAEPRMALLLRKFIAQAKM